MTPSYISHLFRQFINKSYTEYIVLLRLEHARELLLTSDLTLEDIADRSGFANARSMSGYFKNAYGSLPSVSAETAVKALEPYPKEALPVPDQSPWQLAKSPFSQSPWR